MKRLIRWSSVVLLYLGGAFGGIGLVLVAQQWLFRFDDVRIFGNSTRAQVARAVYLHYYDKQKARVFVDRVFRCDDQDRACIRDSLIGLDPHMIGNDFGLPSSSRTPPLKHHITTKSLGHLLYVSIPSFKYPHPAANREASIRKLDPIAAFLARTSPEQLVVIDLRDSRGGRIWPALALASLFIPSGTVTESAYHQGWMYRLLSFILDPRVFTERGVRSLVAFSLELPSARKVQARTVYVVINENTVSAAEYFALILKKYSHIKVVFVGDHASKGLANTTISATQAAGRTIYVTVGITPGLPSRVEPEMSLASFERILGIKLDRIEQGR